MTPRRSTEGKGCVDWHWSAMVRGETERKGWLHIDLLWREVSRRQRLDSVWLEFKKSRKNLFNNRLIRFCRRWNRKQRLTLWTVSGASCSWRETCGFCTTSWRGQRRSESATARLSKVSSDPSRLLKKEESRCFTNVIMISICLSVCRFH